jgi:hypothetical protein
MQLFASHANFLPLFFTILHVFCSHNLNFLWSVHFHPLSFKFLPFPRSSPKLYRPVLPSPPRPPPEPWILACENGYFCELPLKQAWRTQILPACFIFLLGADDKLMLVMIPHDQLSYVACHDTYSMLRLSGSQDLLPAFILHQPENEGLSSSRLVATDSVMPAVTWLTARFVHGFTIIKYPPWFIVLHHGCALTPDLIYYISL